VEQPGDEIGLLGAGTGVDRSFLSPAVRRRPWRTRPGTGMPRAGSIARPNRGFANSRL
jgi:hypothetical protein